MFKFLQKLWVRVRGIFLQAGDDLVTSGPEAIKSVYAAAIQESMSNLKEMKEGMGMLMQQKQRQINMKDNLAKELSQVEESLEGALRMAELEPDNPIHREAGAKYLTRKANLKEKLGQTDNEIESMEDMLTNYKSKFAEMQSALDDLRREKAESVAEYMTAKNSLRLEEKLSGIVTESTIDESIVAIREKIENMKAQAQVSAEMRGATTQAEDVYAEIGAERNAASEFDRLLEARAQVAIEPERLREIG